MQIGQTSFLHFLDLRKAKKLLFGLYVNILQNGINRLALLTSAAVGFVPGGAFCLLSEIE